jgi:Zn-dependent protease with chaperone function
MVLEYESLDMPQTPTSTNNTRPDGPGDSLVDDFHGTFVPPSNSWRYVLALMAGSLILIALVVLYFGMILMVLWLVFGQVLDADSWVAGTEPSGLGGYAFRFLLSMAGLLVTAVLLKPLFARPADESAGFTLLESDQPKLFAFIRKICQETQSPVPVEIVADCHVNASASLRRGMKSLFSRDLVLRVGLPLVAGLNTRQLAGIFAHELGHFSQGFAMSLTYTVRTINGWFARVVYERDEWDETLERWLVEKNWPRKILGTVMRPLIWSGRAVLWLLMTIGRISNCLVLRHMEYDADAYEVKISGGEIFEETSLRMAELSAFYSLAIDNMRETYKSGRLPDNFPLYLQSFEEAIPAEKLEEFRSKVVKGRTSLWESHPGLADRIEAVGLLQEKGMFRREEPGGVLFVNFPDLCKAVTAHFYRQEMDLPTSELLLMNTDDSIEETGRKNEERSRLYDLLGEGIAYLVPFRLGPRGAVLHELLEPAVLEGVRQELEEGIAEIVGTSEKIDDLMVARAFFDNEYKFKASDFGLEEISAEEINAATAAWKARREEAEREIQPVQEKLAGHLLAGLDHLAPSFHQRCAEVSDALEALADVSRQTHEACSLARAMFVVMETIVHHPEPDRILLYSTNMATAIRGLLEETRDRLKEVRYPYEHAQEKITLAEYVVRPARTEEAFIIKAYLDAQYQGDILSELYLQVLAGLVQLAEIGWDAPKTMAA